MSKRKLQRVKVKSYWVFPKRVKKKDGSYREAYEVKAHRRQMPGPPEKIRYTYKIEALVEYQGRYLMQFSMDKSLKGDLAIEYYHTHFEPTRKAASKDFHEQIKVLNTYGHIIEFLSIDLYRVSGIGILSEKKWKLLKSYSSPEKVPSGA